MSPSGGGPPDPAMVEALEAELKRCLTLLPAPYDEMAGMIRHHFGWLSSGEEAGGKRLRPRLTLLCAADAGGEWETALPAAAAVELIHNFSLIHDDIQDGSETRRGRTTIWSRWGVPQAINTGDFVFVASHLACHRLLATGVPAETAYQAQHLLDQACLGLTHGQHLDLAFEGRRDVKAEDYLEMIAGKTAGLVAAATAIGALIGRADDPLQETYYRFGWNLGMAFQLLDDLLGIWGEPEQTGKSAADDLRQRKKTYPVLLGLGHSADFRRLWEQDGPAAGRVDGLQQALNRTPARQETQERAAGYTRDAMNALRSAPRRGPARGELEDLAQRLLSRDR